MEVSEAHVTLCFPLSSSHTRMAMAWPAVVWRRRAGPGPGHQTNAPYGLRAPGPALCLAPSFDSILPNQSWQRRRGQLASRTLINAGRWAHRGKGLHARRHINGRDGLGQGGTVIRPVRWIGHDCLFFLSEWAHASRSSASPGLNVLSRITVLRGACDAGTDTLKICFDCHTSECKALVK